jgi:hypothetical protein
MKSFEIVLYKCGVQLFILHNSWLLLFILRNSWLSLSTQLKTTCNRKLLAFTERCVSQFYSGCRPVWRPVAVPSDSCQDTWQALLPVSLAPLIISVSHGVKFHRFRWVSVGKVTRIGVEVKQQKFACDPKVVWLSLSQFLRLRCLLYKQLVFWMLCSPTHSSAGL